MTTTRTLTTADLDRAAGDDRWLGFGYLGERARQNDTVEAEAVDRRVIALANDRRWSYDDLFTWCNSKPGRWFGDVVFGGTGRLDVRIDDAIRCNLFLVPTS